MYVKSERPHMWVKNYIPYKEYDEIGSYNNHPTLATLR